MNRNNIPVYGHLYGDIESPGLPDALHSERLEQRSAFHDWTIKPHRHDQLVQIFAVVKGGGEATIDGKLMTFSAPYLIFVPSLTVHSFNYFPDSSGFVLSAFKEEISSCIKGVPHLNALLSLPFSIASTANKELLELVLQQMNQFHEEYRRNKPGRLLALRSILSLILVNLGRCSSQDNERLATTQHRDQRRVMQLMEIIEKHFAENHSTEFYAEAMNITPAKLRQMTQSILGVSAHQLINNRILLEAKRNILYTSMTASQVAHMLGFKDPAYFSRFFKKHTGLSPSAYRKNSIKSA